MALLSRKGLTNSISALRTRLVSPDEGIRVGDLIVGNITEIRPFGVILHTVVTEHRVLVYLSNIGVQGSADIVNNCTKVQVHICPMLPI